LSASAYFPGFTSPPASNSATIIEQVVCKLRNAIMQGELRPGQKLVEGDLCRTLGVSRASLREALRALEAEKLIKIVPNRGPSVASLGYREIEAIQEVWAMLAGDAVADFTRGAKPRDIAELEDVVASLERAISANAPLDQLAATNRFLAMIMEKRGNGVLTDIVISLVSRINFLRAQALLRQGWGTVHAEEIRNIVRAIKAGHAEEARRETCRHIASVCAALASEPDPASSAAIPVRKPRRRDHAVGEHARAG